MVLRGTSSRRLGSSNVLRALIKTMSSRGVIGAFVLLMILMSILTLGQVPSEGPTINSIRSNDGFYAFYNNSTYNLIAFSFTANGTPDAGQGLKIVFTNTTTQANEAVTGTIGVSGMAELNFTSNSTWLAEMYTRDPTGGYQPSGGYTIGPSDPSSAQFFNYLVIYDHGSRDRAGFVVFYVSTAGSSAQKTQFRISYSNYTSGITSLRPDTTPASPSEYTGTVFIGNANNFQYVDLYISYSFVPPDVSVLYGTLQYNSGSGWNNVSAYYNTGSAPEIFIRPSYQYLDPQVYSAFFGTDILMVSLFGIVFAFFTFGNPKATHSMELLLAKPLSRSDVIISKYFGSLILIASAVLLTLAISDGLLLYYFSVFLNAYAFLMVFSVLLLVAAIFMAITFFISALAKGYATILITPLAIMFFLYYVFGSLINGLSQLFGSISFKFSQNISAYGSYVSPFQLVSGITERLDLQLRGGSISSPVPFDLEFMILFLLLWCLIPLLFAALIWRRNDI
jgi:ABC-type transport system involved in multi-copper enzyme maturation permease subunit